ncbi:hypothetical protein JRQ81_013265, partial [Phrynocephalus forsythii]
VVVRAAVEWNLHVYSQNFSVDHTEAAIREEVDIGELLIVKLQWISESLFSWSDWWNIPELGIKRVRVKAGETQKKLVFCSQDGFSYLRKGDKVVEFVRCHINSSNDADS